MGGEILSYCLMINIKKRNNNMGYRSLNRYERSIEAERQEAFNRVFDPIADILDNWDSGELDVTLVELVMPKDRDIVKFVDNNVTVREFLEELLDHKSIEISDTVAREEIIDAVCKHLNTIKKGCVKYDDLLDSYMLFSFDQ